jgi:hypothetical protein
VQVDDFQPEAGDPLYQPGQGSLIGQLGAEGCHAWAGADLAVVECRAQRGACLARKVISYVVIAPPGHAPRRLLVRCAGRLAGG